MERRGALEDTDVGTRDNADPAKVARDGWDAMMAGEGCRWPQPMSCPPPYWPNRDRESEAKQGDPEPPLKSYRAAGLKMLGALLCRRRSPEKNA